VHGGRGGAAAACHRHGNAATRRGVPDEGGPTLRGGTATAVAAVGMAAAAAREATRRSHVPRQRQDADAAAVVRQNPARERRRQYGDEEEVTRSFWSGGRLKARPQQYFKHKEP